MRQVDSGTISLPRSSGSSLSPTRWIQQDRDSGISTEADSEAELSKRQKQHQQHQQQQRPVYPFSDDEEALPLEQSPRQPAGLTAAVFTSSSYYAFQADQALSSIKELVRDENWKKTLKHKSGVMVYMLQPPKQSSKVDSKAPIFKGEAVIHGFSPQSVFYVIGMRKLWDPHFEEGRLIENLNETTSVTYESYRASSSSRAYDVSLVEKIECSTDGVIIFSCTSIESSKIPEIPGKNRRHLKLQGWILKPLHTNPPSTKVTFITQEYVKGWIPGLTKKSLARRPLVIAEVQAYLQQKADRGGARDRAPSIASSNLSPASASNAGRRPSILTGNASPSSNASLSPSSHLHPRSTRPQITGILTNPPPRKSSLQPVSPTASRSSSVNKRIKFADDGESSVHSSTPSNVQEPNNASDMSLHAPSTVTTASATPTKLYPPSRHRSVRKQSLETLKRLATSDIEEWKPIGERNTAKLYSKSIQGYSLPILRGDTVIGNSWSPEQICSVIQCFGARKIWDDYFETGHVVERFSQKEYLIYTQMRSVFPIHSRDFSLLTTLESDPATGSIHIATASVNDSLIPESKPHVRGNVLIYGWVLTPIKSEQGKLTAVKVTFVSHLDMQGTTPLPPAIVRLLTSEMPACVDRVHWYLRQHGCPPYIRRVAGKVTTETFDSKDKVYHVVYIAKHTPSSSSRHHQQRQHADPSLWCTDIRTHRSMYSSGFTVEAHPAEQVRVELRADCMGIRIYTVSDAVEGQTVSIRIGPNLESGEKPQYICNDVSMLSAPPETRASTPSTVKDSPLSPPGFDDLTHPHATTKFMQAGDEDDQNPTKQSWESSSSPDKEDNWSPVSKTGSENQQQQQQGMPGGHLKPVESLPPLRRNSSVLVISDELTFTGPQLAFMFLLMAVFYYMGKLSCRCY